MDIQPLDFDDMKTPERLSQYVKAGRSHRPVRLDSDSKFLTELIELVGLHGQNWTSRFGRSYQYEFYIKEKNPEIGLLVEISAIVPIAFVYYGHRVYETYGGFEDYCSDIPKDPVYGHYREKVVQFLVEKGYKILPHEARSRKYDDKTLCELLIYDPED